MGRLQPAYQPHRRLRPHLGQAARLALAGDRPRAVRRLSLRRAASASRQRAGADLAHGCLHARQTAGTPCAIPALICMPICCSDARDREAMPSAALVA